MRAIRLCMVVSTTGADYEDKGTALPVNLDNELPLRVE